MTDTANPALDAAEAAARAFAERTTQQNEGYRVFTGEAVPDDSSARALDALSDVIAAELSRTLHKLAPMAFIGGDELGQNAMVVAAAEIFARQVALFAVLVDEESVDDIFDKVAAVARLNAATFFASERERYAKFMAAEEAAAPKEPAEPHEVPETVAEKLPEEEAAAHVGDVESNTFNAEVEDNG